MAPESQMTLLEHLAELRTRTLRSAIAVVLCTLLSFWLFYGVAKEVLEAPLHAVNPRTTNPIAAHNPLVRRLRPYLSGDRAPESVGLHAMTLPEAFMVKIKVSLLLGAVIAAPFVLYQGWAFVGAGLTEHERRAVRRYVPVSIALFLLGTAFAYFVALPVAVMFFLGVDPEITPVLRYDPYFRLVAVSVGMFGVAFQMPLLAMALAGLGILPSTVLAKRRPYALVGMFVLAALFSPPDPFSQCLLAVPLLGLYELGILLARIAERRKGTA